MLYIIIYDPQYTSYNLIPNILPSVLPKHHTILEYDVRDADIYTYMFYLRQYLLFYCGRYRTNKLERLNMFYERWNRIGFDPNISYYKNLMYLLLDRVIIEEPNKNECVNLSNLMPYMIRNGIIDYLLPMDIFKICMLSHKYYDTIYPRLLSMKDDDLRFVEVEDDVIYAYSNGYVCMYNDGDVMTTLSNNDIPCYINSNRITTVQDEICYVSRLLPYPIKLQEKDDMMLSFDIEHRDPMRDYYSAIQGGSLCYPMQLALRGLWTDSSRHLIKDYYVNDVMRDIEYDIIEYNDHGNDHDNGNGDIQSSIEHISRNVNAVLYNDHHIREYDIGTMLTIDGEYVYDKKSTLTPYGIFNTSVGRLSYYYGSSIYHIHVCNGIRGPCHIFDYRGDITWLPGKYLGHGRWELGDPEETFKYHISYDENKTILEAVLYK